MTISLFFPEIQQSQSFYNLLSRSSPMSVAKVLAQVRKETIPSKKEEQDAFSKVKPIIKKIQDSIPHADAVIGGSGAKGTWLKTFDVDVFVMFHYKDYEKRSAELSDILGKALKKKFRSVQRLHGSRDYFRIADNGITFEVIPILKISKAAQAKNITDISPLHTKWVRKHKKLADEIRLTKQFCKANNLYGAESYIRGFSGYVCEILTIHHGSFLKLLKAAARWKEATVIDVAGYYRKKNVFLEMNRSKLVSPLIVIDPVQHDRNAAAALSPEKFSHFILKAGEFLSAPSIGFFREKSWDREELKKEHRGKKIVMIHLAPPEGKDDIVGSKMMKVYEFLEQQAGRHHFTALYSDWQWNRKDDASIAFVFGGKPLPPTIEREGPPLFARQHVEKFRKLHKEVFTRGKRLYAVEPRPYTVPEALFADALKDNYVKERTSGARIEVL